MKSFFDLRENKQITEAVKVSRKDFDKLKKGSMITIDYGSSVSRSNKRTFMVKGKSRSAKYNVDKVNMVDPQKPGGMKFHLYSRDGGDATLALGDMGATINSYSIKEAALKTSDYPKGTSMSAQKFKNSQKKMSKQRALSTKDYPKGTSMSATAWKNRQEEVELDEQRVVAVPADAKLKLKKGQQVLLYTTRGGQKMKIAVDKSQAFKALGHYRSMGMTNVSLESVQEGVEEGMSKKNYKAQKSKTQKKSFNSLRGRLADENEEEIAESNMDALRKIVDDKAMGKINGVKVDMTTAHMMLTVHKALNDKNKKALEGLVNGDKAQFMRAHALVMKILSK